MSTREGITGTGALHYPPDPDLLKGVLASEQHSPVYPENRCLLCERSGVIETERCFHRHWRVADESPRRETR